MESSLDALRKTMKILKKSVGIFQYRNLYIHKHVGKSPGYKHFRNFIEMLDESQDFFQSIYLLF